jgi:hypothetical protein
MASAAATLAVAGAALRLANPYDALVYLQKSEQTGT